MKIEAKDVFAVEIDGNFYHLEHVPTDLELKEGDLIMRGDEEENDLYFCESCEKQIV